MRSLLAQSPRTTRWLLLGSIGLALTVAIGPVHAQSPDPQKDSTDASPKSDPDELSFDRQTRRWLKLPSRPIAVPENTGEFWLGYAVRERMPSGVVSLNFSVQGEVHSTTIVKKLSFSEGVKHWHDLRVLLPKASSSISISLSGASTGVVLSRPAFITTAEKPNVILISIDTLRADYLNTMGYQAYPTSPWIDRLAKSGTTFTHAIAPSPWTIPSHMAVFTGRDPDSIGMNKFINETPRLSSEVTTLAELMTNAGYLSIAFTGSGTIAAKNGFSDGFYAYQETYAPNKFIQRDMESNAYLLSRFMNEHRTRPTFLFLHTFEVHGPYIHSRFARPQLKGYAKSRARYASGIAYTDSALSHLMDELEALEVTRNSLIILMSDHGEGFEGPGRDAHGQTLFDEVLKVPLILSGPGIPKSHRVDAQVPLQDLFATLVDYLDLNADGPVQSNTLMPFLTDSSSGSRPVYLCCTAHFVQREGWRTPEFKYIISHPHDKTKEQLFDLRNDPGEKRNLLRQPDGRSTVILDEMRRNMKERTRARSISTSSEAVEVEAGTEEQLRALGYLE